jgi:ATP-dependent RNA helicase DDX31/DBP7
MDDTPLLLNVVDTQSNTPKQPKKKQNKPAKKSIESKSTKKNVESKSTAKNIESKSVKHIESGTTDKEETSAQNRPKFVTSRLFTANPAVPTRVDRWKAEKERQQNGSTSVVITNGVLDDGTFAGLGLDHDIVQHLAEKMQMTRPTAIQRGALLHALHTDRDVILQAVTGSGKTLAYLLPMIHQLVHATPTNITAESASQARTELRQLGMLGCILAPTRELAHQVYQTLERLLQFKTTTGENGHRRLHWMVPGIVSGGDKRQSEKARLRKGVTILVCTPGRLLDHLQNTKSFAVDQLRWMILDEADRLLDLGFEEVLVNILKLLAERSQLAKTKHTSVVDQLLRQLPKQRQTILCSATLQENVRRLAGQRLRNPIVIKGDTNVIEPTDLADEQEEMEVDETTTTTTQEANIADAAPKQLRQSYVVVPAKLRLVTLVTFLQSIYGVHGVQCLERKNKVVLFVSCCDSVDFHHRLLVDSRVSNETSDTTPEETTSEETKPSENKTDLGVIGATLPKVPLFKLHGNMDQADRARVYKDFCNASRGLLVCTDVAARGLHLPDVDQIIQYDAPCDLRDYVHRVGRTARLGRTGDALLFLLPSEMAYVDVLRGQGMQPILIAMEDILNRLSSKRSEVQHLATQLQLQFERWTMARPEAATLARQAFIAHVRAYATHSAAEKHIFHVRFLHLGHLAKSFGLREAPSQVSAAQKKKRKATTTKPSKQTKTFEPPRQASEPKDTARALMRAAAKRAQENEFAVVSNPHTLVKRRKKH